VSPSGAGFISLAAEGPAVAETERKRVDMTTGAIAPRLARLAWPLVVGNLLQTFYNLADMFWVGRVSPDAVAAVSLMFPLSWMFVSTAIGITAATIALVSQHVGAGEDRRADHVVAQTLLLTLAVSVALAAAGYAARRQLLAFIGAEGAVFVASLAYIEIIFLSLPFTFLFFAFRASLQGAGDTRTAMWLMLLSAGLNVVIDPVFILGWGPFPAMGTRGAAWATFLARGVAVVAGIYVLLVGGFGVRLRVGDLRPDLPVLRRLVSIGYPSTIDGWARSFAAVVMAALVAPFGTAAIAAYGIGVRLMSVSWTVAGAAGQATATGVGQNLGAGTPDRAARVTGVATGGTMAVLFAAAAACVFAPEFFLGVFVDDPDVIAEGVVFLRVTAPFWAFFGGTMVIQGAFRGAGRTEVAMALSFLSRWVFRVPIALVLAFGAVTVPGTALVLDVGPNVGVVGVWVAYAAGSFVSFLVAVGWFRRGGWTEGVLESAGEDGDDPKPVPPEDLDAGND
jgi:putative MATE family efflux protein